MPVYSKTGPFTNGAGPGIAKAFLDAVEDQLVHAIQDDGSVPMTGPLKLTSGQPIKDNAHPSSRFFGFGLNGSTMMGMEGQDVDLCLSMSNSGSLGTGGFIVSFNSDSVDGATWKYIISGKISTQLRFNDGGLQVRRSTDGTPTAGSVVTWAAYEVIWPSVSFP